jgi:hypothetical protein
LRSKLFEGTTFVLRECLKSNGIRFLHFPVQNKLIPGRESGLIFTAPSSSRASSIAAFGDGARCGRRQCVPRWSAGRRSGLRHWPCAPCKWRLLVTNCPPWVRSTDPRKVRRGASQAPGAVASRVYPTCAPNVPMSAKAPRFEGQRKTGIQANRAARKPSPRAAKHWLRRLFEN